MHRSPYENANVISYRFSLCYIRFFVMPCGVVWFVCEWSKMLLRVLQRYAAPCGLSVNAALYDTGGRAEIRLSHHR